MFAAQRQCCEFSGRNATDLARTEQAQCESHQHSTGHFWLHCSLFPSSRRRRIRQTIKSRLPCTTWSSKRVFAVDVLRCHSCGGRREVLALITEGSVVRAILECLGLPADAPVIHPARGPPELF